MQPASLPAPQPREGWHKGNLAIISCVPEGVAPWKGEEGTTVPIQVNLEDNDPNDPMTLTLTLYATNADNRGPWTGIRTMTAYNVTSSSYTFNWDGKNDNGAYVDPWTYTFEVDITQTDINYNENPALQVEDSTEYRSRYLDILRSRDAFNNPIYETEFAGYDGGDPNDPNDDIYLYDIRFYDLKDTLDVDASEGELQLYDPNLDEVYTWDVTSLLCLDHEDYDGLDADSTGITHNLLVPVPISVMAEGGTYRFVLHIKDDHLDKYRDHRKRWARDLNGSNGTVAVCIYKGQSIASKPHDGLLAAWNMMHKAKGHYYSYPWNKTMNGMTNTGKNPNPDDNTDPNWHQRTNIYLTSQSSEGYFAFWKGDFIKDASGIHRSSPLIWIYYGHSCPANGNKQDRWLKFSDGQIIGASGQNSSNLSFCFLNQIPREFRVWIRLAVFGACYTELSNFSSMGPENVITFCPRVKEEAFDYFMRFLFVGVQTADDNGPAFCGLVKNGRIELDDATYIRKTMKKAQDRMFKETGLDASISLKAIRDSGGFAILHTVAGPRYRIPLPNEDPGDYDE